MDVAMWRYSAISDVHAGGAGLCDGYSGDCFRWGLFMGDAWAFVKNVLLGSSNSGTRRTPEICLRLAQQFVRGKIHNHRGALHA